MQILHLLYYDQFSLLQVSATYCGHLQGGILVRIYHIERQNIDIYKMLSFTKKA
jgi:hypothetical protein